MIGFQGKIARSLTFSFLLLAFFVVATAFIAAYSVLTVRRDMNVALTRTNMALLTAQIRVECLGMVNLAQQYVSISSDRSSQQSVLVLAQERRARLDELIAEAVDATTSGDLKERTDLAHIQEDVVNLSLQVGRLIQANDRERAYGRETVRAMSRLVLDYELPLTQEITFLQSYEESRAQAAQEHARQVTQATVAALGLVVVFVLLATGYMIYRSFGDIVAPLTRLTKSVEQLRLGRLDTPVEVYRQDEIGVLAETLRSMAHRLSQTLAGLESNLGELQHTQAALTLSEAHYRSLYEDVPVGLVRSTPSGQLLDMNQALVEMLGSPDRETLLAENAVNLYLDKEERIRWQEEMKRANGTWAFETRFKRLDGRVIWIRNISHSVFNDNGELLYYEGSLTDITARKQAEEALSSLNAELDQRVRVRTAELETANRELEAFAYSVSHDLRAPLRGIDGYSKLLLDDYETGLDENGRQYLANVRLATQQMGNLIDDLLKLSRVTRVEMNRSACNLSAIAEDVARILSQRSPERSVQFLIQPEMVVQGDVSLVRIMLDNLMGNAWKFTIRQPYPVIEVGAGTAYGEPVYFVRDNGAGFDMRYVDKLFGAFQRLHDSSEFEGSGIGLATVQRIVRRHGGRVWAESTLGQGATFYFTLPG